MDPLLLLALGASIGLVARISPGPVLTLVLAETLRGGWPRGAAIAAGPLLAAGPIILLAMLLVDRLPPNVEPAMSALGGLFLLYLALTTLLASRHDLPRAARLLSVKTGLGRGILARALSPNPYLFWFFIGAPILVQADRLTRAAFLLGYYVTIVGTNVVLAVAIHRWLNLFSPRVCRALLALGALVLAAYGVLFLNRAAHARAQGSIARRKPSTTSTTELMAISGTRQLVALNTGTCTSTPRGCGGGGKPAGRTPVEIR
jgi:threonine/homoserine/homoserine lactone efflux protein